MADEERRARYSNYPNGCREKAAESAETPDVIAERRRRCPRTAAQSAPH